MVCWDWEAFPLYEYVENNEILGAGQDGPALILGM